MFTLTLARDDIAQLLKAVMPAVSTDDVTPVLTAVHWEIADGWVTLTATDRYRVHQARTKAPEDVEDATFLMQRAQASWLRRTSHGAKRHRTQRVTVTWAPPAPESVHGGMISARVDASEGDGVASFTYEAPAVRGNFPPVGRLVPDVSERAADLVDVQAFSPKFIADLAQLQVGGEPLVFFTPAREEGKRLTPMLVANCDVRRHDWRTRALVQPLLRVV